MYIKLCSNYLVANNNNRLSTGKDFGGDERIKPGQEEVVQ